MIRSHSSSVTSTVTLGFCSAPALLNATSRRPNASTAWFSAACTSSDRVTSQRTARARAEFLDHSGRLLVALVGHIGQHYARAFAREG